eukprot:403357463
MSQIQAAVPRQQVIQRAHSNNFQPRNLQINENQDKENQLKALEGNLNNPNYDLEIARQQQKQRIRDIKISENHKKRDPCSGCLGFLFRNNKKQQAIVQEEVNQRQEHQKNNQRDLQINNNRGRILNQIDNFQRVEDNLRNNQNEGNLMIVQNDQVPPKPSKIKRKIPISRFIKSQYIQKDKAHLVEKRDERPKDKEGKKIFKYLCPICLVYYNEILNCVYCKNYVCLPCARAIIKQELRRTKAMNPVPKQIHITCPQCAVSSTNEELILFEDIDKSQPVRYYSDSPTGTIVLTHEQGLIDECRISISKFNMRGLNDDKLRSLGKSSSSKQGIIIKLPQSNYGSNQFGRDSIANQSNSKSIFGQFVQKAHLQVLRSQDIEDQMASKKLVDILCFSPRQNNKQLHQVIMHDQNQMYQNQQNYLSVGWNNNRNDEENKVHMFQENSAISKQSSSRYSGAYQLSNIKQKQLFWSNEFIKTLNKNQPRNSHSMNKPNGNEKSFKMLRQSRVFEDLEISGPQKTNHLNVNYFNEMNQEPIVLSHRDSSGFDSSIQRDDLSDQDSSSFDVNDRAQNQNMTVTLVKDISQNVMFTSPNRELRQTRKDQIAQQHQQNSDPFKVISQGVFRISELLENQSNYRVKPFSAEDEEIKFADGEDFNNVAFTDTLFEPNEEEQKERELIINAVNNLFQQQSPQNYLEYNSVLPPLKSGRDSLQYSDCDIIEPEEEQNSAVKKIIQGSFKHNEKRNRIISASNQNSPLSHISLDSIERDFKIPGHGSGDKLTEDRDELTNSNLHSNFGVDYISINNKNSLKTSINNLKEDVDYNTIYNNQIQVGPVGDINGKSMLFQDSPIIIPIKKSKKDQVQTSLHNYKSEKIRQQIKKQQVEY